MIAGDLRNGIIDLRYRIDAENEAGVIEHTLAFKHAFSIIPEAGEVADAEDARLLAAKCRAFAELMISRNDAAALRKAAADFDLEADRAAPRKSPGRTA